MLSYFGTDQSQVQRYIGGGSLRESRLGLMFNAICKIPMQFLILGLGVLVFVFYQFEKPPVFFNEVAWQSAAEHGRSNELKAIEANFAVAHAEQRNHLEAWIKARQSGDAEAELAAQEAVLSSRKAIQAIRIQAKGAADLKNRPPEDQPKDTDYVFINFVLDHLPHGAIGLLIATFFAAALSSKAAELNALGSTTTVDFYQQVFKRKVSDSHYVLASKCFIAFWGMVAICFALFANLTENLIQAVNIVGSIFYGVVLGLFLVAFFLRWIGGTSAFWGALMAQLLVFLLFFSGQISDLLTSIDFQLEWLSNLVYRVCGALNDVRKLSFLWYNLIGCVACVLFSLILQLALSSRPERGMPPSTS